MKPLKTLAAALLLGCSVAASAADTDAQLSLDEILEEEQYRESWQETIEDESRLPQWVINLSGTTEPMQALEDDGDNYLVGHLCEPQSCFIERLYVAFSWDKDNAYALYVQLPAGLPADKAPSKHATLRWLGDPNDAQKKLLQEQLKKDPNWY
jgi:hypothetical protein